MSLSSMTGFARDTAALGSLSWAWEIKSVNGKALDIRLRLPAGLDQLEQPVRQALNAAFKRGSLQASLTLQAQGNAERITVNHEILNNYLALARELRDRINIAKPTVEGLLALKGVIEVQGQIRTEAEQNALDDALMLSLQRAIKGLSASRHAEGAQLLQVLNSHINQIEKLYEAALSNPARKPDAIKARLKAQVAELMEGATGLDEQRLYQEAVLLAAKADVKEELDRLSVHIAAARALLHSTEPMGRKFDFLAQEFNREANTLCSKANDSSLTAIGIELKTVIDRLREQVQNIE